MCIRDRFYPLVKKRWYAKLQCKALHIRDSLFEDYFRDSSQIKKDDMIAFLKANAAYTVKDSLSHCCAKTLILVGGKERERLKHCDLSTIPKKSAQNHAP